MAGRKRNLSRNIVASTPIVGQGTSTTVRRRTTGRQATRGMTARQQLAMGRNAGQAVSGADLVQAFQQAGFFKPGLSLQAPETLAAYWLRSNGITI